MHRQHRARQRCGTRDVEWAVGKGWVVECLCYIYHLHDRGMCVCGTTYVWRHSGLAFFRFAKSWFIDTLFIAASSGTFGNIFDFKF